MRADPEREARFVDLIQAHQGLIRKVAALYARNRADREDLFQEITLQLWRSFDRFRGEAAYSTYLYRVALNTALVRLRRARSRLRIDTKTGVEEVEARAENGSDEDLERLYEAIRQLKPIDRAIVLLVLEDRSHAEIASVTGLTANNVATRLSRCKERLRRLLGVAEPAEERAPCSTRS